MLEWGASHIGYFGRGNVGGFLGKGAPVQYWLDHEGGWILLVFVNPSIGSPSGFSSIVCLLPHWNLSRSGIDYGTRVVTVD